MRTTLSLHRETLRTLDAGRASWGAGGLRAQQASDAETDCQGSGSCPEESASCPEQRPVDSAGCLQV